MTGDTMTPEPEPTRGVTMLGWYGREAAGGGGRMWGGEERGEARLAELYGEAGELGGEAGDEVEEHGGEEEVEEERLLTDKSTGSSCVCGAWGWAKACTGTG